MFCVYLYRENIFFSYKFVSAISLQLYPICLICVHSKQLRSCQEVQLLKQIVSAQTETVYQYIAPIFYPVTGNFLEKITEEEDWHNEIMQDVRVDI